MVLVVVGGRARKRWIAVWGGVEKEPAAAVGTGDGSGIDRGANRGGRNVCWRKEVVGSGTNNGGETG